MDDPLAVGVRQAFGRLHHIADRLRHSQRPLALDTCPQVSFLKFHRVIARELSLVPNETVVCAMSLGHADPDAPENRLVTEREPVAAFARFLGFGTGEPAPRENRADAAKPGAPPASTRGAGT